MIRIFTEQEPAGTAITVDGQLVDECVDAVEACATQALSQSRQLRLYLRDVSHIDARGRSLLAVLAAKGVNISATGVYSSYIVAQVGRGDGKSQGKLGADLAPA